MVDARTYRKCPHCGSRHYKRGRTTDIDYIHEKDGTVRRILTEVMMPWHFECLECGYKESEW